MGEGEETVKGVTAGKVAKKSYCLKAGVYGSLSPRFVIHRLRPMREEAAVIPGYDKLLTGWPGGPAGPFGPCSNMQGGKHRSMRRCSSFTLLLRFNPLGHPCPFTALPWLYKQQIYKIIAPHYTVPVSM